MAGVLNKTARQYNLKVSGGKGMPVVKIFLKPGFNVVPDVHWSKALKEPYVQALMEEDKIVAGKSVKSPKEIQAEHRAEVHEKHRVAPKKGGSKKGGKANADEGDGDDL